jgi:hypothetical protein
MSTTAIIAEFLVIGSLTLMTVLFFAFSIFRIDNIQFLLQLKDFSGMLLVIFTIISYYLGALLNHLTFPGYLWIIKILRPLLKLGLLKNLKKVERVNRFIKTGEIWLTSNERIEQDTMRLFVLEHGSGELVERIKYMQSLSRLFKGVSTIIPWLGISYFVWSISMFGNWRNAIAGTALCFMIFVFSVIAALTEDDDYRKEMKLAYKILKEGKD